MEDDDKTGRGWQSRVCETQLIEGFTSPLHSVRTKANRAMSLAIVVASASEGGSIRKRILSKRFSKVSEKRGSLVNGHADLCLSLGGILDNLHTHPTARLPREFLLDANGPNDPSQTHTLCTPPEFGHKPFNGYH